ncbi:MAG: hypothetical protein ABIS50_27040 [Luteolibacter sp.]|uniref:hypothetical protein n=1 Tax=Luteolibacter sp. TaxID=1962973 RepID=UPI003266D3A6
MGFPDYIVRVLAVSTACLLVSCIDGHEEVWLNADGSGRADVTYDLPAAAARFQGGEDGVRKMLGDFLLHTPGIKNSTCEVTTRDGRLTIHVQGSFDSALDLKEISKGESLEKLPSSATGLTGETHVSMKGRTVDFSRTIDAGSALPGSSFMPASQFAGRTLSYIVHLPVAAMESNATRIEDEGRTLVWNFPLAQAIKGPVITRFKAKAPIPTWMLASAGAATFLAGSLALVVVGKLRRRKQLDRG